MDRAIIRHGDALRAPLQAGKRGRLGVHQLAADHGRARRRHLPGRRDFVHDRQPVRRHELHGPAARADRGRVQPAHADVPHRHAGSRANQLLGHDRPEPRRDRIELDSHRGQRDANGRHCGAVPVPPEAEHRHQLRCMGEHPGDQHIVAHDHEPVGQHRVRRAAARCHRRWRRCRHHGGLPQQHRHAVQRALRSVRPGRLARKGIHHRPRLHSSLLDAAVRLHGIDGALSPAPQAAIRFLAVWRRLGHDQRQHALDDRPHADRPDERRPLRHRAALLRGRHPRIIRGGHRGRQGVQRSGSGRIPRHIRDDYGRRD